MLSFSISYPDLIRFPSFADTTERKRDLGMKGDPKTGWMTSQKSIMSIKVKAKFCQGVT
jgi:hypothetical protein